MQSRSLLVLLRIYKTKKEKKKKEKKCNATLQLLITNTWIVIMQGTMRYKNLPLKMQSRSLLVLLRNYKTKKRE